MYVCKNVCMSYGSIAQESAGNERKSPMNYLNLLGRTVDLLRKMFRRCIRGLYQQGKMAAFRCGVTCPMT